VNNVLLAASFASRMANASRTPGIVGLFDEAPAAQLVKPIKRIFHAGIIPRMVRNLIPIK